MAEEWLLDRVRREVRGAHEQQLSEERAKAVREAERELADRLADLEAAQQRTPPGPARALMATFRAVFDKAAGASLEAGVSVSDVEAFNVDRRILDRLVASSSALLELADRYARFKRSHALLSIDRETAALRAEVERQGEELWRAEQQRVQAGWAEGGALRAAFTEEQRARVRGEESLVLTYVREQKELAAGIASREVRSRVKRALQTRAGADEQALQPLVEHAHGRTARLESYLAHIERAAQGGRQGQGLDVEEAADDGRAAAELMAQARRYLSRVEAAAPMLARARDQGLARAVEIASARQVALHTHAAEPPHVAQATAEHSLPLA